MFYIKLNKTKSMDTSEDLKTNQFKKKNISILKEQSNDENTNLLVELVMELPVY